MFTVIMRGGGGGGGPPPRRAKAVWIARGCTCFKAAAVLVQLEARAVAISGGVQFRVGHGMRCSSGRRRVRMLPPVKGMLRACWPGVRRLQ
jgi:hypothetical protein